MITVQIGPLEVHLHYKEIKNLYIKILPKDGQVVVSAPKSMSRAKIDDIVMQRLNWIQDKQKALNSRPKHSDSYLATQDYCYLWGKKYAIKVIECVDKAELKLEADHIEIYIPSNGSPEQQSLILDIFYRAALRQQISELLLQWQEKMGVTINEWGIKSMKTRWGSCNITAKRIWLNLELVKRPIECLELVVVHELVHLFERNHNKRFKAYMDQFLPDWRDRQDILNKVPPLV